MLLGQEIYLFFYRFGLYGIVGLIICSILIGLIIYKTFLIIFIHKSKIENYEDFINIVFNPEKCLFNVSFFLSKIINIFLLFSFFIMVSGFSAYFEQQLGITKIISGVFFSIICYFVLKKNISGVTKVNTLIVPILMFIIIIISIINLNKFNPNFDFSFNNSNWILNSILYCSYNMSLLIPLIVTLSKYIKNKNQIKKIAFITSVIILVLASSIFLLLSSTKSNYENIQMPTVYVIDKLFPKFKVIYGITVLLSIFSTAISIGISFLKNIESKENSYTHNLIKMCIMSAIISNIKFSYLLKIFFPMFGCIGFLQIMFIIVYKV